MEPKERPRRTVVLRHIAAEKTERLHQQHGDKVRFLLAGGFNVAVGYGLFALMLFLLDDPVGSLSGSAVLSVSAGEEHYYGLIQ